MSNRTAAPRKLDLSLIWKVFGTAFFVYLFFGFMLIPCLNTLSQVFTANPDDPLAVIKFFFAGNMPSFVWNSLKLAIALVVTVNVVGVSIVLLTEYFDIKGARILRLGYMTTLIYSGVALVTGYLFLYDNDGIITTWLVRLFPDIDKSWFSGFNAVWFTMTFACTSNHALFLRNAIRGIDYNTVEAARNMGAGPFKVLLKVVFPTLIPTMFSLTVMTFITGLCAMSAPTLLGFDSINPEIVRLAGSSTADEAFPQARAALLSIILAIFTIVLLAILSAYERKGHYLSVSKTKAKLVKQKINNPVANVLAHIYAYVLWIIYMTPVAMIVLFAFQNHSATSLKTPSLDSFTLVNFIGTQDYEYMTSRGKLRTRVGSISGVFSNADTIGGIKTSFILSAIAAALACVIVVVAVNYIFKHKNKLRATVLEYSLLFPWLLPTILICYSYRIFFNSDDVWYVFNQNLYYRENVRLLIIIAYTVVKLPFALRMIKASFYAIDEELEDAAKNLGASGLRTFMQVKLPIILPSVLAVFALNFNALFTEYDMGATFHSSYGKTYAMVIQNMTHEEGRDGYNVNATGRRNASTVFIMCVSGAILYLVYGVGARDLGERLEARRRWRERMKRMKNLKYVDTAAKWAIRIVRYHNRS
ncbi:MAG: iron ABC transporter permease [Clostridia bacterium]|nr:iron ABC transporter permease [Clostridia bacterium]